MDQAGLLICATFPILIRHLPKITRIGNDRRWRQFHDREGGARGSLLMASVENSEIMHAEGGIAAIAIFRRLAVLCNPDSAAPLPLAMES